MNRWHLTAALTAAVLCFASQFCRAQDPAPENFARAWLIEVDGQRRAAHRASTPLPPASLTKMMSGLLVIEAMATRATRAAPTQRISRYAASATGSRIALREAEVYRVEDLLSAMLMASANDACRALAEWHSGNETAFVAQMNARARQLKLHQTQFKNACGYDAPGHLSSANDLATLARYVMALPEYARRAAQVNASIQSLSGENNASSVIPVAATGRVINFGNQNQLIGRLPGAIGVKSGFTARAGKCVAAMAERDGHRALLVMLDASNRWWDAHAALDYALRRAPDLVR